MFPGIDGFHWTVGHVVFLIVVLCRRGDDLCDGGFSGVAHGTRFSHASARSICAGSRTLRSCRSRTGDAVTNLAGRVISRTCDNAVRLPPLRANTRNLPCCPRREWRTPWDSTIPRTASTIAGTLG